MAETKRKRREKQQGTPEDREKFRKRNYASQRDTLNAAHRDDYATQPDAEREACSKRSTQREI